MAVQRASHRRNTSPWQGLEVECAQYRTPLWRPVLRGPDGVIVPNKSYPDETKGVHAQGSTNLARYPVRRSFRHSAQNLRLF